jgi:MFS transporter, ACS family, glucarate transporter
MLLGGTLGDFTTRRFGDRWGRALPIAGSRLMIGLAYAVCLIQPTAGTVLAMMIVVAFATDLGMAPMWAWTQDVGGRHVGSVMGWANMWGNFGAAIFPLVAKQLKLSNPDHAWPILFGICAASQIVAAVAALGIDARRKFV